MKKTNVNRKFIKGKKKTLKKQRYDLDGGYKRKIEFNQTLKFELHLIKLDCNDSWVSKTIREAKNLMDQDIYPDGSFGCDTCRYLKKRWDVSQKI